MYAPQLDTGIMTHIGAAVESRMYANFARDTLKRSVTGRAIAPTARLWK